MSVARLKQRAPSATSHGRHHLEEHLLKFHKKGGDGSAKCDALYTGLPEDKVYGVLFDIDECHKPALDKAEGLGRGYEKKSVIVLGDNGNEVEAFTYYATHIDQSLLPYSWYLNHVLTGALEFGLPAHYIQRYISVAHQQDYDLQRDARQRAVHLKAKK